MMLRFRSRSLSTASWGFPVEADATTNNLDDEEGNSALQLKLVNSRPDRLLACSPALERLVCNGQLWVVGTDGCVIGRNPGVGGIKITEDATLSARHAAFKYNFRDKAYTIEDIGSRNGIILTNKSLEKSTLYESDGPNILEDESVIYIGSLEIHTKIISRSSMEDSASLVKAIRGQSITEVKTILDSKKEAVNMYTLCDLDSTQAKTIPRAVGGSPIWYPLHIAVMENKQEIVQLLLERNADANLCAGPRWRSPLHAACANGNLPITSLLLAHGADCNILDADGHSPTMLAPFTASECLSLLSECTMFGIANARDDYREVRRIVTQASKSGIHNHVRALVNARGLHSQAPLHIAAKNGSTKIGSLLLQEGANVNALAGMIPSDIATAAERVVNGTSLQPSMSRTPLHVAVLGGHFRMAELLLRNGALINAIDSRGYIPLEYAQSLEVASVLNSHSQVQGIESCLPFWVGAQVGDVLSLRKSIQSNSKHSKSSTARVGSDNRPTRLNERSPHGFTSLHLASDAGHLDAVEFLLEQKAAVDLYSIGNMWTPLHMACVQGHVDVARVLVAAGADPDTQDTQNHTVVQRVTRKIEELELLVGSLLLDTGSISPSRADGPNDHSSVSRIRKNIRSLQLVLEVLLGPQKRFDQACMNGQVRIIETMVVSGAIAVDASIPRSLFYNPNSEDRGPVAAANAMLAESESADTQPFPATLLHWNGADEQLVETLLEKNGLIDAIGPNLETPLHTACREGRSHIAKVFCSRGANLNATDMSMRTPLHLAAHNNEIACVEVLMEAGASVHARDCYGDTAFDSSSDMAILDILAQGPQLLAVAVLRGETAEIGQLLQSGLCHVDDHCIKNKTALHIASQTGSARMVWQLLQCNANINAIGGSYQFTPLHYAACEDHEEVVELLVAHGADRNITDRDGNRAVDLTESEQIRHCLLPNRIVSEVIVPPLESDTLETSPTDGADDFDDNTTTPFSAVIDADTGLSVQEIGTDEVEGNEWITDTVDMAREGSAQASGQKATTQGATRSRDPGICKICLEAPIDTILLPCGHEAFCFSCASKISSCALDRQHIREVVRVFRVE
eukprot:m.56873 g.56873  ORF g.56873 m.56873 type:complete len:1086 (-) comp11066_c0_seq3:275-3532(-)